MHSLPIVQFHSISKGFGPKALFSKLDLSISQGEKLALIGENGSGKTTLARLILGELCPDGGTVSRAKGCQIGYLPQDLPLDNLALTLEAFLLDAQGNLHAIQKRLKELEEEMLRPIDQEKALAEWDALYQAFEKQGGYEAAEFSSQCLKALGLQDIPRTRKLSELSGGELRRAQLAALLLRPHDLLILDEPTNHLDAEALLWLENYLQKSPSAILLISHDRSFINRCANGLLELADNALTYYSGNYDCYLVIKKKEVHAKIAAYQEQKEEMKHLHSFLKEETFSTKRVPPPKDKNKMAYDHRGERHVNSKRKKISQAKSRLQNLQETPLVNPRPKYYTGISFSSPQLIGDLPFSARLGSRVVLTGPNGCGKTTLLRHLASDPTLFPPSAIVAYLPQDIHFLDPTLTPLAYLQNHFSLPEHELRSRLRRIDLFEDSLINQPISTLSLGQKRRLQLLHLMLTNANVLLLDEPTNHLAPSLIDELEDALATFPGLVIAATHDQRFIEKVATQIIDLRNDEVKIERMD